MTQERIMAGLEPEFASVVAPLLGHRDVLSMHRFRHHDRTALTHSLGVSRMAYRMARRLRLDARSVARGGLLHDFFLYDRREGKNPKHATRHARVALENARARFSLNAVEEDIILAHMWPVGKPFYRYRESMLVSLVDKIVSIKEVLALFGQTLAAGVARFRSRQAASLG